MWCVCGRLTIALWGGGGGGGGGTHWISTMETHTGSTSHWVLVDDNISRGTHT